MDVIDRNRFLEAFPSFRNGSEELVDQILSLSRHTRIPPNVIVKLEGDPCQDFVLVLSGEKRIYKTSATAREITLYEIGAGDICVLNASCILSDTRLPASCSTNTETEVLLLYSQYFLDFMNRYEALRKFVYKRLNQGFTSVTSLVSEITFGKMDERLIDYLLEKSGNQKLFKTHQQIARDLGTSREVVSRLLKDFERKGMVSLSRNCIELIKGF